VYLLLWHALLPPQFLDFNNEIIFEVQSRNNIIDSLIVKRNTIGVSGTATPATITTSSAACNNNDR
jgi:hypothetical protein